MEFKLDTQLDYKVAKITYNYVLNLRFRPMLFENAQTWHFEVSIFF